MTLYSVMLCFGLLTVGADGKDGDAIPKKIRELAAPKADKEYSEAADRERYVDGFADGFKSGLTSPDATVLFRSSRKDDPHVAGSEEGRKIALAQPKEGKKNVTLLDFGYIKKTATGSVRMDPEQWEFRPNGTKAVWWFSLLVDGMELDMALRENENVIVTVDGFLSPKKSMNGYGHFGMYKREFIVTKIKEIKIPEKRNDKKKSEWFTADVESAATHF